MIIVCVSSPEPTGGIQECFASTAVSNTKLEPTKTEKMPKKQQNLMFLKSNAFREKSKNHKKSWKTFFLKLSENDFYDKTKCY